MQNSFPKEIQTGGGRTQFDIMLQGDSGPLINLCVGAPGEEALKRSASVFKQGAEHALGQDLAYTMFQYGPLHGAASFRRQLANFLSEEYRSEVDMDDLIETAGASQGLTLLSNLMFEAGDLVFVEEKSYFIALKLLSNDRGLKVVPVAMDDNGMVPKALERAIKENSGGIPQVITAAKPYWAMVYMMPTFQNPTGFCLSPDRCQEVVELARRYNLLVVCDDVYNLLYFPSPDQDVVSPKRLFAYDNKQDPDYKGNVVSNGSFSKIFGPGIRLGWIEAPSVVVQKVVNSGCLNSGGAFNHTTSIIMASVMQLGLLKEVIEASRKYNQKQCEIFCKALRKELPSSAFFVQPKSWLLVCPSKHLTHIKEDAASWDGLAIQTVAYGGYFVWVSLPNSVDAQDVLDECRSKYSVTFMPGRNCSPERKFNNCIRLSFVFFETDKLLEAAAAIGKVTKSLLK